MSTRTVAKRESTNIDTQLNRIASQLREEVVEAERQYQSAVQHAIRAGELLNEARDLVPHGSWSTWLAANFDGTAGVANTYMRLAKHRAEIAHAQTITAAVAFLAPAKAQASTVLAAPRDPDPLGDYRRASSALARALAYADDWEPTTPPSGYLPINEFRKRAEQLVRKAEEWEQPVSPRRAGQTRRAGRVSQPAVRKAAGQRS